MFGKCTGGSKKMDKKLVELDFSNHFMEAFPKVGKKDFKTVLYANFDNNHFSEMPKVFSSF